MAALGCLCSFFVRSDFRIRSAVDVETTADDLVKISPSTAKALRGNMLLLRSQVSSSSAQKKVDIVVQDLTEGLVLAGHGGPDEEALDDDEEDLDEEA